MILLLIGLLILALTGAFWFVLKIAFAVALGLFVAVVAIAALVRWRYRRALYGPRGKWRRVRGSSNVTVLYRKP